MMRDTNTGHTKQIPNIKTWPFDSEHIRSHLFLQLAKCDRTPCSTKTTRKQCGWATNRCRWSFKPEGDIDDGECVDIKTNKRLYKYPRKSLRWEWARIKNVVVGSFIVSSEKRHMTTIDRDIAIQLISHLSHVLGRRNLFHDSKLPSLTKTELGELSIEELRNILITFEKNIDFR
jgi:hypothetical protein